MSSIIQRPIRHVSLSANWGRYLELMSNVNTTGNVDFIIMIITEPTDDPYNGHKTQQSKEQCNINLHCNSFRWIMKMVACLWAQGQVRSRWGPHFKRITNLPNPWRVNAQQDGDLGENELCEHCTELIRKVCVLDLVEGPIGMSVLGPQPGSGHGARRGNGLSPSAAECVCVWGCGGLNSRGPSEQPFSAEWERQVCSAHSITVCACLWATLKSWILMGLAAHSNLCGSTKYSSVLQGERKRCPVTHTEKKKQCGGLKM